MTKPPHPLGEGRGEGIQQCNLHGLGVLITRPKHQAQPLYDAILRNGGNPILFPTIEIVPPEDPKRSKQQLQNATKYDDLIFISPNAVRYAMDNIVIDHQRIFAIGEATGKILQQHNLKHYLPMGEKADSESLLASPKLKVMQGRRVLIIRGNGGRSLLSDALIKRGAIVDYCEVYQRRCPNVDATSLLQKWPQEIDVVIATSNDIINNLLEICLNDVIVLQTQIVVINRRMQKHAENCGFKNINLSSGPGVDKIINSLYRLSPRDTDKVHQQ